MIYGKEYLIRQLNNKRAGVIKRYDYYDMHELTREMQISTPPKVRWLKPRLGWCGKSVDAVADRLRFRGFKDDDWDIMSIYNMNNPDVLFDSAILSALIASCCFVYVTKGDDGAPRMQVIDGGNATGIVDPITGFLSEGYAVLERDENDNVLLDAYFLQGATEYTDYMEGRSYVIEHNNNYCLLVPIIYRPDAKRPFGHSRISRACMYYQDEAVRTLKRAAISAEFYSFPQKYATGISDDIEIDKWQASMSALLTFTKDADGDSPTLGQFSQQSMAPHLEQLKSIASLFAGESGLTLDDLGFASGNPSSADAIKASHENLRLMAKKAQGNIGRGFLNAGIVAACLRDDTNYERAGFAGTVPLWYPSFVSDGSAMSGIGDAIIKINQAVPDYFNEEKIEEIIGY